jgi:hypothetical protein
MADLMGKLTPEQEREADSLAAKADAIEKEADALLEDLKKNPTWRLVYWRDCGVGCGDQVALSTIDEEDKDAEGEIEYRLAVPANDNETSIEAFTKLLMAGDITQDYEQSSGYSPEFHYRVARESPISVGEREIALFRRTEVLEKILKETIANIPEFAGVEIETDYVLRDVDDDTCDFVQLISLVIKK